MPDGDIKQELKLYIKQLLKNNVAIPMIIKLVGKKFPAVDPSEMPLFVDLHTGPVIRSLHLSYRICLPLGIIGCFGSRALAAVSSGMGSSGSIFNLFFWGFLILGFYGLNCYRRHRAITSTK